MLGNSSDQLRPKATAYIEQITELILKVYKGSKNSKSPKLLSLGLLYFLSFILLSSI